jgi:hypothetical protein
MTDTRRAWTFSPPYALSVETPVAIVSKQRDSTLPDTLRTTQERSQSSPFADPPTNNNSNRRTRLEAGFEPTTFGL